MTSENLRAWIVANDAPGVELVRCPANTPDVQSSAKALGVAVDDIVKSIVLCCDGAFAVCVTNGTARVDHKKIARRLGVANKRVRLATRDETLAHAGFAPGTVPPFGHRAKLRTFVAIDLATRFDPDDVVYGGGGCVDVEVRCTVRDLLRLTNGTVMDVKRDDDVCVNKGAQLDGSTQLDGTAGSNVDTAGDDARVLPVDPALDERVGPARLPIAKRVADVMGRSPEMESRVDAAEDESSGETSLLEPRRVDARSLEFMPAWPAPRPREDDPDAPRAIETCAEVIRVRRVARFLAFATLRPLAPLRVLESDETNGLNPETNGSNPNSDAPAQARAGDTKRHALSLPAGTELQLIAGRTLLERVPGGEAAAESTLRGLRPGAVVRVGRLQANPRPLTVDVVASTVDLVEGNEAVAMLARATTVTTVTTTTIGDPTRVMPPASPGVTYTAWSRSKRLDKKREKKRLEAEAMAGLGPDTDDRYDDRYDDADGRRELLRGLRVGERVGKMRKFPPLGSGRVTWVDDASGIETMRTAVLDPSTRRRDDRYDDRYDDDDGAAPDAPWVVGLDAEWRPHKHSPVALLQVATRREAFLVDVASLMRRDEGGNRYDRYDRYDENAEAFDAFLRDLLDAPDVVRLGFGFEYDLSRLRRGYAGRLSSLERRREENANDEDTDKCRVNKFGETGHALGTRVVDVKALALCAFPDKRKLTRVGLATLVASVLGAYVDKTEQCSDWERRPLTNDQVDYAAADAHVLTVLFDKCFNHAPAAVAKALADPAAPLATPPPRTEADERTRSRAGGGRVDATSRGRRRRGVGRPEGSAFVAPARPPPRPTRFPRWSATCSRDGSRWRRRSAAEKARRRPAAAPTSAATFSRSSSTWGGRTGGTRTSSGSRRSRSNPTSRGVMMSWFPGGGGPREIASALVEAPSEEGVAEGSEKSASAKKTPLLFLRPAKGAYTCVGRLAPVRTRVSGEGRAGGLSPGGRARAEGEGSRGVFEARGRRLRKVSPSASEVFSNPCTSHGGGDDGTADAFFGAFGGRREARVRRCGV